MLSFKSWFESFDTNLPTFKNRFRSAGKGGEHSEQFEIGNRREYSKCLYDTGGSPECEKLYSRYKVEVDHYYYDAINRWQYNDFFGAGLKWYHIPVLEVHFARQVRLGKFDQTNVANTGNVMKVFSTVMNIADKYIDMYDPGIIMTMVDTSEQSRVRLYRSMARRLMGETAYTEDVSGKLQNLENRPGFLVIALAKPEAANSMRVAEYARQRETQHGPQHDPHLDGPGPHERQAVHPGDAVSGGPTSGRTGGRPLGP